MSWNSLIIVSGDGLVPGGTKPLPEPMLTYYQWVCMALAWAEFSGNAQEISPWNEFENDTLEITKTPIEGAIELTLYGWVMSARTGESGHCSFSTKSLSKPVLTYHQ